MDNEMWISAKKKGFFAVIKESFCQIPVEHRGFYKQIVLLAKNDLIKTYKGAVIGPFWAVMKPLFQLFVYWFAFTIALNRSPVAGDIPFFVFAMTGFIPWCFMSDCVSRGSKCIRENRQFVNKIAFPVSTIPTYTTLSKFYVHLFLFVLAYVYLITQGYYPDVYHLQLIGYAALMFMFFLALTWSLAPMCAFSKDLESLITTIMTGLFWLSGVCFNSYKIENDFVRRTMMFNPMTYFCNGYRKCLLYDQWFFEGFYHPDYENLIFLAEFVIVVLLGIFNYSRLRKRLPDVL